MIDISFAASPRKKEEACCFFLLDNLAWGEEAKKLDQATGGALSAALKESSKFKGKEGEILSLFIPSETPSRIFLVGLGKKDEAEAAFERIGAKLALRLDGEGIKNAALSIEKLKGLEASLPDMAARLAQGAQIRLYRFERFKTKKKKDEDKKIHLETLTFVLPEAAKAKRAFEPLQKTAEGVFFARDLACQPANVLYPESMAAEIETLKKLGVKVRALGEAEMQKLGMGSLLSVSQGSDKAPRMVVMEWNGLGAAKKGKKKTAAPPIALIGKGVTFDSGGISLKPGAGMGDMKYDMCGAAAVTGAMKSLAGRKAKAHVVGLVGLVENMPSGKATRPGDIVTSASGQTIEILNTDAEGRRVLADVLWYAQKHYKPRCLVDLATLTGAMSVALGQEYAGLFSNDDKLAGALEKAGTEVGELLWRMPLCKNFDKKLDSDFADMKDIGGPKAGSCTAAQFLKRFVEEGNAWAHLDIAGVAYGNADNPLAPEGPTGFGVRLLDRFVAQFAEK